MSLKDVARRLVPLSPRTKIQQALWRRLQLDWTRRSGIKLRVRSQADWVAYNEIFVDGDYDEPIRRAITGAKGTLNVLDIGANVGFFSLRVIDKLHETNITPRIAMIEGSPAVAAELKRRVGALPNVTVINGLVGEREGRAAISEYDYHIQNMIVQDGGTPVDFIDLYKVLDGETIDLLKCDIEGAELLFLRNYPEILKRTRVAVFELHHDKCDLKECLSHLAVFANNKLLDQAAGTSVHQFWNE